MRLPGRSCLHLRFGHGRLRRERLTGGDEPARFLARGRTAGAPVEQSLHEVERAALPGFERALGVLRVGDRAETEEDELPGARRVENARQDQLGEDLETCARLDRTLHGARTD